MKASLTIFFLFVLAVPFTSFSQDQKWLTAIFRNADSVVIVSHEATAGVWIVDSLGKEIELPKLLINGKPNYSIITEYKLVSGGARDSLTRIISRPFKDLKIETGKCFIPHHAIFVFRDKQVSYIDICFGCKGYETSENLRQLEPFDARKWKELQEFFLKRGLKYKMELEEED